eukprot:5928293-Pleurochrysis_carterae.AAC.1
MTIGKAEMTLDDPPPHLLATLLPHLSGDAASAASSTSATNLNWPGDFQAGPRCNLEDDWVGEHSMVLFSKDGVEKHSCAYCGHIPRKYCATCDSLGQGKLAMCGRCSTRDCLDKHARGAPVEHASWKCAPPK